MQYLITFLEGVIAFISPCMLPMIPIYISYFAGDSREPAEMGRRPGRAPLNAAAFILGFTAVFALMGIFAGSIGALLTSHQSMVNFICGLIVIALGLEYLGLFHIHLPGIRMGSVKADSPAYAFLFGVVFSVVMTPCTGAFLGSALMMAAVSETAVRGLTLLITYSLGLGIPFMLSALLIDRVKSASLVIKRNYRIVNVACGIFLIVIGILMAAGLISKFWNLFI